jgi:hypothetical protein
MSETYLGDLKSMRNHELKVEFVKYVPQELTQGVLYVSEEFGTAIHLCACGWCRVKTVTPFHIGDRGWKYTRSEDDKVTLLPSIGNYQMPCKSHYWLKDNQIVWID